MHMKAHLLTVFCGTVMSHPVDVCAHIHVPLALWPSFSSGLWASSRLLAKVLGGSFAAALGPSTRLSSTLVGMCVKGGAGQCDTDNNERWHCELHYCWLTHAWVRRQQEEQKWLPSLFAFSVCSPPPFPLSLERAVEWCWGWRTCWSWPISPWELLLTAIFFALVVVEVKWSVGCTLWNSIVALLVVMLNVCDILPPHRSLRLSLGMPVMEAVGVLCFSVGLGACSPSLCWGRDLLAQEPLELPLVLDVWWWRLFPTKTVPFWDWTTSVTKGLESACQL